MKTLTPESAEQILKTFGDNSRIGDVLEKMLLKYDLDFHGEYGVFMEKLNRLVAFWELCGIEKSLQIVAEEGWEEIECIDPRIEGSIRKDKVLKPEVESLLLFIQSLKL